MLKFRQDFEAGIFSAFCRWCFVEVLNLNLGRGSEDRFSQDFEFKFIGDADVWLRSRCSVEILKMTLIKICVWTCDMTSISYFGKMNSTLGSVVPLAMFSWCFKSRFWRWNVLKICVWTCDMTSRSYFGKMNSTLGSVVPLAMFQNKWRVMARLRIYLLLWS